MKPRAKHLSLLPIIGYCGFWIGNSVGMVGEVSSSCAEPFGRTLPLAFAVFVCLPILLAYGAGFREGKKADEESA